jgi:hypothetical protein
MAANANAKINAMRETGLGAADLTVVLGGDLAVVVLGGEVALEHSILKDWEPGGGSVLMQSPGVPPRVVPSAKMQPLSL